jgi:hypothetical protein
MRLPRAVTLPEHDPVAFWKLFEDETDRAAAVLGGSYLDAILEQVLRSWMPPNAEKTVDAFFEPHGFLGTFGARKNMAFALGIVDTEARDDIQRIANIRNFFAHHVLEADSFDNEAVRQELARMSFHPFPSELKLFGAKAEPLIEKWKAFSPRQFYLSSVERLVRQARIWRVGPRPAGIGEFRQTVELVSILRADSKFAASTLDRWHSMDPDQQTVPDAWKE